MTSVENASLPNGQAAGPPTTSTTSAAVGSVGGSAPVGVAIAAATVAAASQASAATTATAGAPAAAATTTTSTTTTQTAVGENPTARMSNSSDQHANASNSSTTLAPAATTTTNAAAANHTMMMGGGANAQQRASIATTIDSSATGPIQQHGGGGGYNNNSTAPYSIGIGDHQPRNNHQQQQQQHHQHQHQHRAYRPNRTSSDSENEGRGIGGGHYGGHQHHHHDDDDEDGAGDGDVDDDYGQRQRGSVAADIDSNNGVFVRGALSGFHTFRPGPRYGGGTSSSGGGFWGAGRPAAAAAAPPGATHHSRAVSPTGGIGGAVGQHMDDMSEHSSSQMPMMMAAAVPAMVRSKSRTDLLAGAATGPTSSRYGNLSYWKARRVLFYRNGDPFFPGVEFRFKPFRDIASLEALLDKISPKMDLPRGARYVFSMDGDRKYNLDELEDGASYVLSSFKGFKPASYGKKNGMWYGSPGNQGWGSKSLSRKPSVVEASDGIGPQTSSTAIKPSAGRVIRIINSLDHSVQCRVLLNLRTSQPFEEVVEDLGQVLKMTGAKRMYTAGGQEVRSFSQLRNEFADIDTFYLGTSSSVMIPPPILTADRSGNVVGSPVRRSRSRAGMSTAATAVAAASGMMGGGGGADEAIGGGAGGGSSSAKGRQRARSKSRPRVLYAPESEIVRPSGDYTLLDVMKEDPTKVIIRGLRRTFYPPIHHAPMDNSPPDKKLQLHWVHGYRGIDSRRNLWVLPSGELLYYVAAVAVLLDREEEAQRHYTGHTEDIMCMDVHPSRELVASGQRAGRERKSQAHVRIWSTESLQTLYVFGMGELDAGVSSVAFSQLNGGSYILAVDGGRESILSVWQWQWGHLLGKVATLQEGLTGAAFHPLDDNLIITHGRGHLAFWHRRKDGFFERTDIIKQPSRTHVTSIQFEPDGDVVTADSDGFITIYSVDSDGAYFVRMEFEAHNKGISCLVMLSEGTLLSGGEKDRKIAAWDSLQNYKRITDTKLPETAGGVRTIYPQRPGRNDGNIYVGTTRNNILEGSLQRRFNQVVFGHGRQLWGLAAHPEDELFATAGHDKHIALWRKHKLLWSAQVGYECVSLAFHPFGTALAAGSSEGHLLVLNAENGAIMLTLRVCGSPLNCVGFNQIGDMIAMGSQNGSIYLFRVSRDGFSYKKINKIRGSQPLTHLDWSVDGGYLQTVTVDFDLLFWDVKSMSPERSPVAMKDVKWLTQFCTVGFLVAGIWSNRYYATTSSIITTSSRATAEDMLVAGDADGYLRLFRYPCISPRAEYGEAKVYSGTLASARFLYGDRSVVTVGGTDASLMVWELVEE